MALVMVMAMGITVFAIDGVATDSTPATGNVITINNVKGGHEYEAYQVFKGNVSTSGILTNVEWGSGVNVDSLYVDKDFIKMFTAATAGTVTKYTGTAQDVSAVLEGYKDDSAELDAFAEIVGNYLNEDNKIVSTETTNATGSTYTISGLDDGYYLVKDADDSIANKTEDAYTKYILKVVGDVSVTAKAEIPTIEKKIVETQTKEVEGADGQKTTETSEVKVDYNNASLGDTVNYELTTKVPSMNGYDKYFFIVNDTMSKGLTYVDNSIAIKIVTADGNIVLIKDSDYKITTNKDNTTGETSIKIVFLNFINKKLYAGCDIIINYSALVNDNAVIGSTGNPNKVDLTYSNNPNVKYEGENEPSGDDPYGKTPENWTVTYVTSIDILKIGGNDDDNPLAGATFQISGETLNTVFVTVQEYVEDEDGIYWKLKDGTYTTTDPSKANVNTDKYDSTETKYNLEEKTKKETKPAAGTYTAEATTGETGELIFSGLSAGTYTITETKAPEGYNKLEGEISITIGFEEPEYIPTDGTEKSTWKIPTATYTINETATTLDGEVKVSNDGHITLKINNNKGTVLPSTGGTGVKVLYTVGAILAIGAAILLITRRRMKMMD
jgi:fimbrial isopeptide formation D2 family protein/LPXTG-motif cell wall-anchored protein